MGCLFGCFRVRNDEQRKTHLFSSSIASKSKDALVSKNQLASVFLREDEGSPSEQVAHLRSQGNADKDSLDRELKCEAKFLKSCGTLLETPAEIRKAPVNDQTPDENGGSSNFHSWLPAKSCKELLWYEQNDQPSPWVNRDSCFSENSSGRHTSEKHQALSNNGSNLPAVTSGGFEHFEAVEHESEDISQFQSCSHPPQVSECSPFPTPLKLSDEMQTPATVYPVKLDNLRTGKNTRICAQYVYPVLNPVENLAQRKTIKDGSSHFDQSNDHFEQQIVSGSPDAGEKTQQTSLTSVCGDAEVSSSLSLTSSNDRRSVNNEVAYEDKYIPGDSLNNVATPLDSRKKAPSSTDNPQIVVTSLSQRLRPQPMNDMKGNSQCVKKGRSHSGKSPGEDRPIIGMVAAHWNDQEPSRQSPKWWDGNGIPNSTNKYKEDQKVKWHATPFEERLEKALSDESFCPQRKLLGKPVVFEEGEESDTAAS